MKRWIASLTFALATMVVAVPAVAQQTETFRWEGEIDRGETVSVKGINGEVEARPTTGRTLRVEAQMRSKRGSVRDLDVDVRQTSGGITICGVYPLEDGGTKNACDRGRSGDMRNGTSIDFVVHVPPGVDFEGRTVNGGIETGDLDGNVSVSTVNGGIEVAGTGTVQAKTVNGAIEAETGAASWDGDLEFKTVNGSITVTLPANANARVEAKTVNGGLDTDFPLTIQGRWGPRRMEGTIGQGGGTLELETVNGAIRLRRS
ncbi:MAG: DUF4097 family beta strand repeat-containing protein [Gemmatimonadota bacterium]|nr:DUF4097 family beta strand repeat-containing protein [Gemmatimonadota bacterium]